MTLTIRTPAKLLHADTQAVLADGLAVIWADPQGWGGIFEAQEHGDELCAAVAGQPLTAQLRTHDGRTAMVTLTLSEFIADGARPLVFRGQGTLDRAQFKAFSEAAV